MTTKLQNLLSDRFLPVESSREESWESFALAEIEERALAAKAKQDLSGLGVREHRYLIPPRLLMSCHPNLAQLASHRRDPPPPIPIKPLAELLREKRGLKDVEEPTTEEEPEPPALPTDLDLATLLRMDEPIREASPKRGEIKLNLRKPGSIYIPHTFSDAKQWRRSRSYQFCQQFPVWQPDTAKRPDYELCLQMGRICRVLLQVSRVIKSGVRKLRGSQINDATDLLNAMNPEQTPKLPSSIVPDAIHVLGVQVPEEQVQELVSQMDSGNTGEIDREELADAFTSPKSTVNMYYNRARKTTDEAILNSEGGLSLEDLSEASDVVVEAVEELHTTWEVQPATSLRLHLTAEQERPRSATLNALPGRPLSAHSLRGTKTSPKEAESPVKRPRVGKFHAMQLRLRRRQLKSPETRSKTPGRVLVEIKDGESLSPVSPGSRAFSILSKFDERASRLCA